MRKNRHLIILLAAAMLLMLCACNALEPIESEKATSAPEPSSSVLPQPSSAPVQSAGQVRVLCASDCGMADEIILLAGKDGVPFELIVTEYENDADAVSALEADKADIVICAGGNTALSGGSIFVPISYSAYVLAVNDAALRASGCTDSAFSSMESLFEAARTCGEKNGKVFFAAESYTDLFACGMRQLGELFTGEFDTENESFVYIYNLIAEAAFTGGVADTNDALAAVRSGETVCAAVSAARLTEADIKTLRIFPVPPSENGSLLHTGVCTGYYVVGESEAVKAAADWLMRSDTSTRLALSVHGVPSACADTVPDDALSAVLCDISKTCMLAASYEEPYSENAEQFEKDFRAALDMLR